MLRRRLQDLTYCISYNVNFLHDKAHGAKQFRKKYTVLEELGRGGFGIVYKAERNVDGAPVAVKFIEHKRVREWSMKCKQLIPTEICLLDICRDVPGVVQLIDWFANSKGFLIVMERPEQCMDLFDMISVYGYLDEDVARSIFVQILNTACLLYNTYGIFHRDIKDENIIINMDTGEAILVDFGAAALISEACVKEFQGTRSYCPPEWFKRLSYMPLEATVWSLGIILYVMVCGCLPFQNEIQICLGRLIIPKHVSKDCENLLRQCLAVTPSRRPNLLEICKHRWLNHPVALHSELFKNVLQSNLKEKLKAQLQAKLNQKIKDDSAGKNAMDCSVKVCVSNECTKMAKRSSSSNISAVDSPVIQLLPHVNIPLNSELQMKHRRHSSYDNMVMSIRTDMLAQRDCYDPENNLLISSSSIEEVTKAESTNQHSGSPFYSVCESFCSISTDPQNSDSYSTALEGTRMSSPRESKRTAVVEAFNKSLPGRTLPVLGRTSNSYEKKEAVSANSLDKPSVSCNTCEAVMNSRLVAKHWPCNVSTAFRQSPPKLQRPKSSQQGQQQQLALDNRCLGIFSIESRLPTTFGTAAAISE